MLSPGLGKKRRCLECEAAFYDLNRDPITCPKCGATHQPAAARLKSDGREPPKGRTFTRRKPEPVAAEPAAAEAPELLEDDLDPAEDAEADEHEADDGDDEDRAGGDDVERDSDETGGDENR
jgi:uncharacterized protein (TIGR02300 family)